MADQDMNPAGEMRDPDEMIRQMKLDARATEREQIQAMTGQGPAAIEFQPSTPEVLPKDIEIKPRDLASGVYEGAGGYKYEVMSGGEIKILDAPAGRGVGVTLKFGHPAHEAIFEELSAGGAKPKDMSSEPADKSDDDRDRAEESKTLSEMMKDEKDASKIAMSPEAEAAFDRVKNRK